MYADARKERQIREEITVLLSLFPSFDETTIREIIDAAEANSRSRSNRIEVVANATRLLCGIERLAMLPIDQG